MEVRAPAPMLPALPTPSGELTVAAVAAPTPRSPWWQCQRSLPPPLPSAPATLLRGLRALAAALAAQVPFSLPPLRRLLAPLLLVLLLVGCSADAQPPRRVVLQALSLQIRLTQDQVAQALNLQPTGLPEVSRVRVEQQQPVAIGEARGLRLSGRFDWRLAEDPIRVDSPFELYLQRGERGQTWRLARPLALGEAGEQSWLTEPLPLPGERPAAAVAGSANGSGGAG